MIFYYVKLTIPSLKRFLYAHKYILDYLRNSYLGFFYIRDYDGPLIFLVIFLLINSMRIFL